MEDQKFDKVKDLSAKRKRTTSIMLYLLVGSGAALYVVFMLTFVLGLIFSFVLLVPYYRGFDYVGIDNCYLKNEFNCVSVPPTTTCTYTVVAVTPQIGNVTKDFFLPKTSAYQVPCIFNFFFNF
jgi:hypothetical protein